MNAPDDRDETIRTLLLLLSERETESEMLTREGLPVGGRDSDEALANHRSDAAGSLDELILDARAAIEADTEEIEGAVESAIYTMRQSGGPAPTVDEILDDLSTPSPNADTDRKAIAAELQRQYCSHGDPHCLICEQ